MLITEKLSFFIGENRIIENFNFRMNEGEIVAILGESGVGKSTILFLLAGLENPSAGKIYLNENEVIPPARKLVAGHPEIKLVRQDYGLFPNISIRENIAYELRLYTADYRNERVDYLLNLCGLNEIANRLPRQTSGGEQQRAVIARAIADEPRLLLLDEPFSHLDKRNKEILKDEIGAIVAAEQMGCIFVTHEVSDAYRIAERVLVLENGKIVQDASPEIIYNEPFNEYVAVLTGNANCLTEEALLALQMEANAPVLIRPEWIIASANGMIGIVTDCVFYGMTYLITIQFKSIFLQLYSAEKKAVGDKIHFKLSKFWQLNKE